MAVAGGLPGRIYQAVRSPENLLIEARPDALSAAGYPLPHDDPARGASPQQK